MVVDRSRSGGRLGGHFQSCSARVAEIGVGRTGTATTPALQVRGGMTAMNDQIANIWNPRKGVRKNENRIAIVKDSVDQQ